MTAKAPPETPQSPPLAVIGAGSWGTALAQLLGEKGHTVRLWAFEPEVYQALARDRVNSTFLPGVRLPASVSFTQDFAEALSGVPVMVMAVPSHVFRLDRRASGRRLHTLLECGELFERVGLEQAEIGIHRILEAGKAQDYRLT